eukprot:TRINITY_DN6052_c0_g2_i1.p1 TRINITY_DN6052_c0_g2~~TRINITY_DN6052_c0_g2_i1.p1  ORF type:complete len:188 (+),score=71.03 TRINITY_DN6052_c0_g2_i1:446-1009(+)
MADQPPYQRPGRAKYDSAAELGAGGGRNGELLRCGGAGGVEGFWEVAERMFLKVMREHSAAHDGGGREEDGRAFVPLAAVEHLYNNLSAAKDRCVAQQNVEADELRAQLRAVEAQLATQNAKLYKYEQKFRQIHMIKQQGREQKHAANSTPAAAPADPARQRSHTVQARPGGPPPSLSVSPSQSQQR